MTSQQSFLEACNEWLCDGYFPDLRYLAHVGAGHTELVAGLLSFHPLPPSRDHNLSLRTQHVAAGQVQFPHMSRAALLDMVSNAMRGVLAPGVEQYALPVGESELRHVVPRPDDWFTPLRMNIHGAEPRGIVDRLTTIDDALRSCEPPFDGLRDLVGWLGLAAPQPGRLTTLELAVSPPVDIFYDQCSLSEDRLRLTLHAHPAFDVSSLRLGVVLLPRDGLKGRVQAAHAIQWSETLNNRRQGLIDLEAPNSESALAMLTIGSRTVRRQWFQDPSKAPNPRLVATQHFDRDLRMTRQALFEATDSKRFETAVSALLFLLGFAPTRQLETDAPDLIASTPTGKIVLIECTLRLADVSTKVGKLIGRTVAAEKSLRNSGHHSGVVALLVCRSSRAEIGPQQAIIRDAGACLVAEEEITDALLRTRFRQDPDRLLEELVAAQSAET